MKGFIYQNWEKSDNRGIGHGGSGRLRGTSEDGLVSPPPCTSASEMFFGKSKGRQGFASWWREDCQSDPNVKNMTIRKKTSQYWHCSRPMVHCLQKRSMEKSSRFGSDRIRIMAGEKVWVRWMVFLVSSAWRQVFRARRSCLWSRILQNRNRCGSKGHHMNGLNPIFSFCLHDIYAIPQKKHWANSPYWL